MERRPREHGPGIDTGILFCNRKLSINADIRGYWYDSLEVFGRAVPGDYEGKDLLT